MRNFSKIGDSIRDILGFNADSLYGTNNLSPDTVDNMSFDKICLERNTAPGMVFKGKRSIIFRNFTIDVDPGYKYIESFREGNQ